MFSKEMEALIQASIEDGVLTDLEKSVLVKRAQKENIDIDELEVYIDSLLQKQRKSNLILEKSDENSKEQWHGKVSKCPNCGAPVEAGIAKCVACGYAFSGLEANKSAEKLAEKLIAVKGENQFERSEKQATIISSFPIPTTKEDLMEFMISMTAKEKVIGDFAQYDRCLKEAYRAKMGECITKARISFPNDPTVLSIIAETQAALDVPLRNIALVIAKWFGIVFAILLILAIILIAFGI
jgi:hypothetical protein